MPEYSINGIRIAGISVAVPATLENLNEQNGIEKIVAVTGVHRRYISRDDQCTSDLCATAAEKLLKSLGWDASSVDLLIFITQTPDYVLPATSLAIHGRLGLSSNCAAFDVNLGCSGYVYGLSIAANHLRAGGAHRVLLLAGDTISKVVSKSDRSVAFLFGDAGSATALEQTDTSEMAHFVIGSDGSGVDHLKIEAGMFRRRSSEATRVRITKEGGNIRSQEDLFMNGPEIFNFTIREVPTMVEKVLRLANWAPTYPDVYVFHQANKFMLDYLTKRMNLPAEKVVSGIKRFGNTSSASIPLAICSELKDKISGNEKRLILAGFGVGFSWGALAIKVNQIQVLPVITLD